jgi:hypothetical protein
MCCVYAWFRVTTYICFSLRISSSKATRICPDVANMCIDRGTKCVTVFEYFLSDDVLKSCCFRQLTICSRDVVLGSFDWWQELPRALTRGPDLTAYSTIRTWTVLYTFNAALGILEEKQAMLPTKSEYWKWEAKQQLQVPSITAGWIRFN